MNVAIEGVNIWSENIDPEDEMTETYNIFLNENFDQTIAATTPPGHTQCYDVDHSNETLTDDKSDEYGRILFEAKVYGDTGAEVKFDAPGIKLYKSATEKLTPGTYYPVYDPDTEQPVPPGIYINVSDTLYVEGTAAGTPTLTVTLKTQDNKTAKDKLKIKVIPLNVVATRPAPSSDQHEICHKDKLIFCVNNNDSDDDGTVDLQDNNVVGGDLNLATITLEKPTGAVATDISGKIAIILPSNIKMYSSDTKVGGEAPTSYALSAIPGTGKTLYLEATAPSGGILDTEIKTEMTLNSGVKCRDEIRYTLVKVDLEIYKAKVVDSSGSMIPADDELTVGSITFVNLDDDDVDGAFDYNPVGNAHDPEVAGGDNELMKVVLKLQPNELEVGKVRLRAPTGGGDIAAWKQKTKATASRYNLTTDELSVLGDFSESGNFLVKTMWVEGLNAHTSQRGTTLRMEYEAAPMKGNQDVALTIIGVDEVKWIGRNNSVSNSDALDSPASPPGTIPGTMRVFPGARASEGGTVGDARNWVDVLVTLTVPPPHDINIYLRAFDVDDPTAFKGPIDDPGSASGTRETADQDNRGGAGPTDKAGIFEAPTLPNNGKKVAFAASSTNMDEQVGFKVTMQPGDNFRVVANGDRQFVYCIENDDGDLDLPGASEAIKTANKQRLVNVFASGGTPDQWEVRNAGDYCSKALVVWRFLHVERDSMAAVVNNNATGNIIGIGKLGPSVGKKITVDSAGLDMNGVGASSLDDGSKDKNPPQGNGRFENGGLYIAGPVTPFDVAANGNLKLNMTDSVTVAFAIYKGPNVKAGKITKLQKIGNHSLMKAANIVMSPNEFRNGTLVVGGASYAVLQNTPTSILTKNGNVVKIPFVLRDDDKITGDVPDPDTSTLDDLMGPAYVLPIIDDVGDNNDIVTFNVNLSTTAERKNALDWDSKPLNADKFWVAYILGAYQREEVEKGVGAAPDSGDSDPDAESSVYGSTFPISGGCLIYMEVHKENKVANPTAEERDTVCHEVSHLFGSTDDPGQPISAGVYTLETLDYIRSPGKPASN